MVPYLIYWSHWREISKKLHPNVRTKDVRFILMYDTKSLIFLLKQGPVPNYLQSHLIYQFECPGCKAKKTDRCLELRLKEHSDFHTSAFGKHLYECEHFQHLVNLFNISEYLDLAPSHIETYYHISSAVSRNTRIIDKNNNRTELCFFGVFVHQKTESRPQWRYQSR